MSLPAFPIAHDAHEALALLRQGSESRAMREREAEHLNGGRVVFVTQSLGPVYQSLDDALDAYAGLVEDERAGKAFTPLPEDRICRLLSRIPDAQRGRLRPVEPVFTAGERWPQREKPVAPVWQLSLGYWKIMAAEPARPKGEGQVSKDQARHLRKKPAAKDLTPEELLALSQNPLMAARPQKSLDFGLFDFIPPDNPSIVIADE
ncbi:hypothetical protein [Asticcacaulis sp. EMRT-3]|uniref:hypothetical protein n=1 Tax=Asticcacaulis sp. EMRT-3 TaxID=3040349 RepID=UPI0024AF00AC|nr:hypothetical protein [Asticcacaulis sp. EMRT-3]MDI7775991.1 hypothetical protein [Asticcacaulis sp. EMRT-3]